MFKTSFLNKPVNLQLELVSDGLKESTQAALNAAGAAKKKKTPAAEVKIEEKAEQVRILLAFKRFIYDPQKRMIQT